MSTDILWFLGLAGILVFALTQERRWLQWMRLTFFNAVAAVLGGLAIHRLLTIVTPPEVGVSLEDVTAIMVFSVWGMQAFVFITLETFGFQRDKDGKEMK